MVKIFGSENDSARFYIKFAGGGSLACKSVQNVLRTSNADGCKSILYLTCTVFLPYSDSDSVITFMRFTVDFFLYAKCSICVS